MRPDGGSQELVLLYKSVTSKRSTSAAKCGKLGASPYDGQNQTGIEAFDFDLIAQRDEAIRACGTAVAENPADLQSQYQLAQALGVTEFGPPENEKPRPIRLRCQCWDH